MGISISSSRRGPAAGLSQRSSVTAARLRRRRYQRSSRPR